MALIYREDFSAGNSLFSSQYSYNRPTDGTDPLYPFIRGAEGVYINGDGYLDHSPDYTGEFETYQQAGIWVKGPGGLNGGGPGNYGGSGWWNASEGYMEARYHPTTLSITDISEEFVTAPLIMLAGPTAVAQLVGVVANLFDATLTVYHENEGSHDDTVTLEGAPMPVAGQPYLVRVAWQCGTWDTDLLEAAADGFVRVWINDELIYEATNISLFFAPLTVPANLVDSVLLGYMGLLGPLEYFEVYDSPVPPEASISFTSGGVEMPIPWIEITFKEVP